jgi:hypothetical protein
MSRQEELIQATGSSGAKEYIFVLDSSAFGQLQLRYAPDGWSESGFKLIRNLKYKGLFRGISVEELTFVKDGKQYVQNVYEAEGVVGNIIFTVYRYDYVNWKYATTPYFQGKIDLTTYVIDETGVKVQIIDTSFVEKIKSRENVKVNLRQDKSINGFTIPTEYDTDLNFNSFNLYDFAGWKLNSPASTTNLTHYLPMLLSLSDFDEAQSQTIAGSDPYFLNSTADVTLILTGSVLGNFTPDATDTWEIIVTLHYGSSQTVLYQFNGVLIGGAIFGFEFDVDESFAVLTSEDSYIDVQIQGFTTCLYDHRFLIL